MPVHKLNSKGSISIFFTIAIILVIIVAGYLLVNRVYFPGKVNIERANSSLVKFKTGLVSGAPTSIQALLIKKYDIDKKYGIDIEYVNTAPGDVEKELIEGKYDMSMSGTLAIYTQSGEKDIKIVFPAQHLSYDIIVPQDSTIKTLKDLKGKKLGVLHKTTAAYPATFIVLKSVGIDPDKDLQLVFGSPDQIVQDLDMGEIDAATIAYPFGAKLLGNDKFKSIIKLEDVWKEKEDGLPLPFVGMVARTEWLNNNYELVRKVAKIYHESALLIKKNPKLITELTSYLDENGIKSAKSIQIVEDRVPELLFETYGQLEVDGIKRYYQRAKEYGFLSHDTPSLDNILILPSELKVE